MDKEIVIVGTGFSGMLAHLILQSSAAVFGVDKVSNSYLSKQSFNFNKLFGVKSYSYTMLKNKLTFSLMHDRLVHGGNGTIWGGFIRFSSLIKKNLNIFNNVGIFFIPLNYKKTGSSSLDKSVFQLQMESGETLNPWKIFSGAENAFLERFEILPNSRIRLHWSNLYDRSAENVKVSECDKLILAVGVVQFIDLLYRSGILKDDDYLELDEFKYSLGISTKISPDYERYCSIKIGFFRALFHYLGIQKYPIFFSILDRYNPIVFQQVFSKKKTSRKFLIKNGALTEESYCNKEIFGRSIHYCNLKINGVNANKFLAEISIKILGLGMAFVDQKMGGPISTDIFEDAIRKLKIEK